MWERRQRVLVSGMKYYKTNWRMYND
jgi:hypothetical protein